MDFPGRQVLSNRLCWQAEDQANSVASLRGEPLGDMRLGGSPVDALAYPYRTVDELAQRVMVDAVEALEVQAAFSGLVRAQPRQHRLMPIFELADQIDDQVLAAGREAGQRRVALVAGKGDR